MKRDDAARRRARASLYGRALTVLALLAMISIPIANSALRWHSRAPLYAETILLVVAIAAIVWTYRQQGS